MTVFQSALVVTVAALALAPRAEAQRADENAVTAASDAFGTVVGTQTIGLYSPTSARGFNPSQAENLRIEGFYYDQQPQSANPYLFSGSDMRVGIAAQSYAFPSPSGIADYRLRIPGDTPSASAVLIRGPLKQYSAEIDSQFPVVKDTLSIGLNVADAQGFDYNYALNSFRRAISLLARITPSPSTEIVPFFGYIYNTERKETPFVYADRMDPVPFFQEQYLPTQGWTTWSWNQVTAGVIAKIGVGGPWSLRGGLFRSVDENSTNFNDLFLGLRPDGTADHVMDVSPAHRMGSYSGDLRAVRSMAEGSHRRELTLAVRARHVDREYGGDSVADLGTASIYQSVSIPEPPISFSARSRDVVQQSGLGINYNESWKNAGSVSLGLLRTDYRRVITSPGLQGNTQHTTMLLPTISFTVDAARMATLYGSYTRGLEDSVMAPSSAVNRGELPPATPTWQADGGVRVLLHPGLQVLLGGFRVHKRYFSLDTADLYSQLGEISTTGIESSVTLTASTGLTVVAGAVWLRPQVKRQVPELGGAGSVPVGPVPRTINVNIDYAPATLGGWAASLQWTSLSSRVVTSDDSYSLAPLTTLNLGVRYRFNLHARKCSVRLDAGNVTNEPGVTISPLYVVVPQLQRNYTLTLAIDL
jgi:iron complex outermembrane receptor protein